MKNLNSNAANSAITTVEKSLNLDFGPSGQSVALVPDKVGIAESASAVNSKYSDLDDSLQPVIFLETKSICIGAMPNRTPEAYSDQPFEELCDLISAAGCNTAPIYVRRISDASLKTSPYHVYELITGQRRLEACIKCKIPIRAIVIEKPLSKESFAFDAIIENLCREGLSPFEFARQILHITTADSAMSLGKLARLLGRDKSLLSRAKSLAELPAEIVGAFGSSRDIRYADAAPLTAAVKQARDAVIGAAIRIREGGEKIGPSEVVKQLVDAAKQVKFASDGTNIGTENGGVAPCNTPTSRALKCADKTIGELTLDRKGQVQVTLRVALNDDQQTALALQIETYIRRRVLRLPAVKPQAKSDRNENASSAVENAASAQQSVNVDGGVA